MFKKLFFMLIAAFFTLSFVACETDGDDPGDTYKEFLLQTDWSGGLGQIDIVDSAMFNSSAGIDFSTVSGQITLSGDYNGAHKMISYNNKLYCSVGGYGIFEYNASNDTWKLQYAGYWWHHATVFDGKIYAVNNVPARIRVFDGTSNDYGFGPNGWSEISNDGLPLYGETDPYFNAYYITEIDGVLYINGGMWSLANQMSAGARVYKFENGSWVQVGQQVEYSSYALVNYNNELYLGTHWSGKLYKLSGSSWVYTGKASGMAITNMAVVNGKLFIGSWTSNYASGYVDQFDGNNWTNIYSGEGITSMTVHNDKLVWGTNPSGKIFIYDETSGASQLYDLDVTSISGLTSFNGGLYSGSYYVTEGSTLDGYIYVNGIKNIRPQCCYLISSGFSSPDSGLWGNLVWNSSEPEGTGIEFWVEGKEPGEEWGAAFGDQWKKTGLDKPIDLDGSDMRYKVYLWSIYEDTTPALYDVSCKLKD